MLHAEPLSGGLVTSRDPSLLNAGELQRTDEASYRPNSQALHPWGWRKLVGTAQKNPQTGLPFEITGLKRLIFDGTSTTLIADGLGLRWRYGPSDSGLWTILPGVNARTVAAPIEAVLVGGNKYVLANGTDRQYVISSDLSVIRHGMTRLAGMVDTIGTQTAIAGVTNCAYDITQSTATGGTWADVRTGFDYYYYWITEYDQVNDIESAYLGENFVTGTAFGTTNLLASEQQDGTTTGILRIQIMYGSNNYPALNNPAATHWRIYRAHLIVQTTVDLPTNPFPAGQRISTWSSTNSTSSIPLTEVPIPAVPATTSRYDFGFDGVEPYPVIVITSQGVSTAISRDTPPPNHFNSGAVFEDSLVTNDTTVPNEIGYSPPGLYHSQPTLYRIAMSPNKWDNVVVVEAVGDKLIVGQNHELWRVNYLPRGEDAIFDTTRVKDLISGDHGVVGPNAACVFSIPGDVPRLAFVSNDGIYSTDGYTIAPITMDLDWRNLVRVNSAINLTMRGTQLVNYTALKALCMFYVPVPVIIGGTPTSSSARIKMLVFSYAPEHLKGGMMKVSGPITIAGSSVDYDPNESFLYTGGYDGQVRIEDGDWKLIEETAELVALNGMQLATRFLHLGGIEGECAIERFWTISEPSWLPERLSDTLGYTVRSANKGIPEEASWSTAFKSGQISRYEKHVTADGVAVNLQGFAPIHFVGLEHTSGGGN